MRCLARLLALMTLLGNAANGVQGAPLHAAAFEIELGASPSAVTSILARQYRSCLPISTVYRRVAEEATDQIAALSINPGLASKDVGSPELCPESPAGSGITDSIEARFVHSSIDAAKPLYSLLVHRLYPDLAYGTRPRVRNAFEEIRAELFRMYGRPTDERREKLASSAADLASSLGIGSMIRRDDHVVRYLWAAKGKLADAEYEATPCDCGQRYVKATMEISRSPSTVPGNVFYVLSLTILVEDNPMRARQDAWNSQWQRSAKP